MNSMDAAFERLRACLNNNQSTLVTHQTIGCNLLSKYLTFRSINLLTFVGVIYIVIRGTNCLNCSPGKNTVW